LRVVHVDPPEIGERDGLAYARFSPARTPTARVVVLHGAGSAKESHYAWGRLCRAHGYAAVCFDMRGHGESSGALDDRALEDIAVMADVAGRSTVPLVLRGSSMGGWMALAAGARLGAAAVVAICPAPGEGLVRALRAGTLPDFAVDVPAVARLVATVSEERAAATLGARLLLQHAAGDETVPVEVSRALHAAAPGSRYIEVPGGHHRSIQHDGELQAEALRFIDRAVGA
jgi:pimeloyl-ACP methyl ester carboxylesterase